MKYLRFVLLVVFAALSLGALAAAAEDDEGILVGRIAHIEGKLLRYVEEEKDWVLTVKDAPFGLEDTLYSEDDTKAEFIMPNGTWIRIGENTQMQLIDLNPDATTVDVASGLARLYNKSGDTVIKVTTPFGYVVAPGDTVFDLYVGDESLEVIAVRGDIDFVHDGTGTRYEVKEGSSSIIADKDEITLGNGTVDADWDDWNEQRDRIWDQRFEARGDSADFLPEPIREESYVLEENGRWERVYYEGAFRDMWRPTRVERGWRPFTAGRWTVYYGDHCWIPDEPFGYVTHHYGSWIYVDSFGAWYWAPPVRRVIVAAPTIFIGFGWYPGRVGWIHSGTSIGWVPLAPNEVYYCNRPWGRRTVVVGRPMVANISISRYRYLNEAVIINRDHFYSGTRYTPYVERNVNRTALVNNYRPATVINNSVINNFNTDKRRFAYNDAKVVRKPHSTVLNRIDANQKLSRDAGRGNRQRIEQDLTRIHTGTQPVQRTDIRAPRLTPKLVDVDKVAKPLSEVSLPQKEIKLKDRERQLSPDTRPNLDRERRGPREQGRIDRTPGVTDQDAGQRIRSPRDAGDQGAKQVAPDTPPQLEEKRRGPREQGRIDRTPGGTDQDAGQRIRSPRDTGDQGAKQVTPDTPPQLEEKRRGLREQGRIDRTPAATDQDAGRRIRSPRDMGEPATIPQIQEKRRGPSEPQLKEQPKSSQEMNQETLRQQEQGRTRQQEMQQRQQQEIQRQQQIEGQRRQQEEAQKQQQQEMQQRQQQEIERQQQIEGQRRQQEEAQKQQQQEMQQRQQQEIERQQQIEGQRRQQEEAQKQQQQEMQQRQQQEIQRQQQIEGQRRQQEEAQKQQQQEMQQRQQQEIQRQQQIEGQRRQQEEAQKRQQQEMQQRQQQEIQRQQQGEAQKRQQQEPQQKKNKKQLEEELLQQQQLQNR